MIDDPPDDLVAPPPLEFLEPATRLIHDAVAKIGDEQNVLTWIATTDGDMGFALVNKVGSHVEIVTWLGKPRGKPVNAGIAGRLHWNW